MSKYLSKAKAELILTQPFFASILLGMPMVEDKNQPTLATDGEQILYNPDFLATLSFKETVFVLAHETMHCVLSHMHRRGNRNANRWNIAADYVINDLLVRDKVGSLPQGALQNPQLVAQGNGTTEGVYNLLPESDDQKQAGDPGNGGSLDQVQDASTDPAELSAKEAEMKVRVIQAANAAKMAGKLSAGLSRIVGEVTKPKTDWRAVLRRFLSERAKTDYSFARPKRRFLAEDILLPGMTGERLGQIVVAVDCSGSINQKILSKFAAEIKAICEDTSPAEVHLVYFDSKVLRHDTFQSDETIEINPMGGGGTAFSPIFEHIDSQGIIPSACVVLTDLDCSDFGEAPGYPVLWASTLLDRAPFGEIVSIQEE